MVMAGRRLDPLAAAALVAWVALALALCLGLVR
jgi:hypothetical protein